MSRIYDNKPLQSVPVQNQTGNWNPQQFQSGSGAILEGKIDSRSRHVITDSKQNKSRYFVLHVRVKIAHRRQFNSKGEEIESNMDATQKVNTGYLMSSYKVEAKGQTDRLTQSQLSALVNKPSLTSLTQRHTPEGCLAFWMTELELKDVEFEDGDVIMLRTKGDGPFIDSVGKLDTSSKEMTNMAGSGQLGESWTDKIMTIKSSQDPPNPKPGQEENEGAGDDEWDD
ncbi:arpin [Strongylocentrotus purpuratus]|uniref:Arpin n=1 Tax=Strongylocentrotus purpuratus TaxID=7668 RepID=A0A7M7RF61_STRPU|nr:arpin [Strongylocentrotus purpuratus]|eukprot:XP_787889.3 PREDICTED: arpin [Strongylocentrotus purpuratus]